MLSYLRAAVDLKFQVYPDKLLSYFEFNKPVKSIEIFQSPTNNLGLKAVKVITLGRVDTSHHQIIFSIQGVWVVLSYGKDGLKCIGTHHKQRIINRRKDNKRIRYDFGPFNSSVILSFLSRVSNNEYNPKNWNCQHFSAQLYDQLSPFRYSCSNCLCFIFLILGLLIYACMIIESQCRRYK